MKIESKDIRKTLTEETWITFEDDKEPEKCAVRVDYPVYPASAKLLRLSLSEGDEPYWSAFVRAIVKEVKNLYIDGKPHQVTIINGFISKMDFDILSAVGFALQIFAEGRRMLDFDEADKKKS